MFFLFFLGGTGCGSAAVLQTGGDRAATNWTSINQRLYP